MYLINHVPMYCMHGRESLLSHMTMVCLLASPGNGTPESHTLVVSFRGRSALMDARKIATHACNASFACMSLAIYIY